MTIIPAGDELLDEVNDDDVVIGTILRSQTMARPFRNFRVVNAFLRNSRGEIWVPQRGPNKRIFPLCLDCSMGGHVGAGEPYDLAFARETQEELGIDIAVMPWKQLGKLSPHLHDVSAFMQVYEIQSDETPDYNPDDYIAFSWMKPAELIAKIESGTPSKGDLPKLVKRFYC